MNFHECLCNLIMFRMIMLDLDFKAYAFSKIQRFIDSKLTNHIIFTNLILTDK